MVRVLTLPIMSPTTSLVRKVNEKYLVKFQFLFFSETRLSSSPSFTSFKSKLSNEVDYDVSWPCSCCKLIQKLQNKIKDLEDTVSNVTNSEDETKSKLLTITAELEGIQTSI